MNFTGSGLICCRKLLIIMFNQTACIRNHCSSIHIYFSAYACYVIHRTLVLSYGVAELGDPFSTNNLLPVRHQAIQWANADIFSTFSKCRCFSYPFVRQTRYQANWIHILHIFSFQTLYPESQFIETECIYLFRNNINLHEPCTTYGVLNNTNTNTINTNATNTNTTNTNSTTNNNNDNLL